MRLRKSLGPGRDRDGRGRLPLDADRRRPRHPALRGAGRTGSGAGGRRGSPERAASTLRARVGAVAGPRRSRTSTAGRRAAARRPGSRSCAAAPRRTCSTPGWRPASTARSPPRRGAGGARSHLRERRWAILALAQYRCGRQADALRSLQRARAHAGRAARHRPRRRAGRARGRRSCARTPTLAAPRRAAGDLARECPYKGLAPYDVGDADRFFGRDAEVAACLERLRGEPAAGRGRPVGVRQVVAGARRAGPGAAAAGPRWSCSIARRRSRRGLDGRAGRCRGRRPRCSWSTSSRSCSRSATTADARRERSVAASGRPRRRARRRS